MSDYFDLSFATLPHKLLQPERFESEVKELRKRFDDRHNGDYVFKPVYHKRIPADGVAPYMESVWDAIMANKDLDLPTQQELLAQFRCDEIASVAFGAFEEETRPLHGPVTAGAILATLGASMGTARETAIAAFDRDASRYHAAVYQRKRAELLAKMHASLSPLFLGQLKNLHKSVLKQYRADISTGLKADGYDFASVIETARTDAESTFRSSADAMILSDTPWAYTDAFAQLQEELAAIADTSRQEETRKMVLLIERNLRRQLAEPLEIALAKPRPTMWDAVLIAFRDALAKAEAQYLKRAKSASASIWTGSDAEQASTAPRPRTRRR